MAGTSVSTKGRKQKNANGTLNTFRNTTRTKTFEHCLLVLLARATNMMVFSIQIWAKVNITAAPPPPQKARLPFYDQKNLVLLQQHSDDLEERGVLVTPESVNAIVVHAMYPLRS